MAKKKPAAVGRFTKVAADRKDGVDGMFATHTVESQDDIAGAVAFLEKEIAANANLDWVRELRDTYKLFGPGCDPSPDPFIETGRELYQVADSILDDSFQQLPIPQIARRLYSLGRAHERLIMQACFNGMVGSAKKTSKANATKALEKSDLSMSQWLVVCEFIHARDKDVSAAAAYRTVLKGLKTTTFKPLPGVSVRKMGEAAIKKQYENYRKALRVGKS